MSFLFPRPDGRRGQFPADLFPLALTKDIGRICHILMGPRRKTRPANPVLNEHRQGGIFPLIQSTSGPIPVIHSYITIRSARTQIYVTVDIDIKQQTKPEHQCQHGGTAVGYQRQRHTNNRQQAHYHGHVHKKVQKEHGHDPHSQQAAKMMTAPE